MYQPSFTIDTSVVVKWLNQEGEADTQQALSLLDKTKKGEFILFSSDLLPIEVVNALIWSKKLRGQPLKEAVKDLFSFPVQLVTTDETLALEAAQIAQEHKITVYDAIYLAIAYRKKTPLITANPRHQGRFKKIPVFTISDWPIPDHEIEIFTDKRLKELLKEDEKN